MNSISLLQKQHTLVIIGLTVIVAGMFSCNRDKNDGPKLVIKDDPVELSAEDPSKSLLIANVGEGILNWNLEDMPPWVEASNMSGELKPGPDEIVFSADLGYNAGVYNTEVQLTSNGGNEVIVMSFNLPVKDFTILPGVGLTDLLLNDTYQEVRELIGEPDTVHHYLYEDPEVYYLHGGVYENQGLFMLFFNYKKSVIDPSDPLVIIECFPPFDGTTDEGLGIGSSLADVEDAYGAAPDTTNFEGQDYSYEMFDYVDRGIAFYYYNGNYDFAETIDIYTSGTLTFRDRLRDPLKPRFNN